MGIKVEDTFLNPGNQRESEMMDGRQAIKKPV